MTDSRVSVVIPTYNYGQFVCQAVDSALAQSYRVAEVIVVDDGSTDDTRQRLAHYEDRIHYIFQQNHGLSAARNTGIRQALGEWIALLDSDDVWHPQKIEIQLRAAQSVPNCGLVGALPADELGVELMTDSACVRLTTRDFLLSAPMGPSSALIHKEGFTRAGLFDESLGPAADRDMWLRLASHVACIRVASRCWWYRLHADQMNRKAMAMLEDYRRVLDKFFATHPEHHDLRRLAYSYLYYDAAWAFHLQGDRLKAVKCLTLSGIIHPRSLSGAVRQLEWGRTKALVHHLLGENLFRLLRSAVT